MLAMVRIFSCYAFRVNIFFLNIASREGMVACVTPERVISSRVADTKISDADLPGLMKDAWGEAGWNPKDITHVATVSGPGGFMSLRVGAATTNALSWGLDVPVASIHLSDLYEARLMVPQPTLHPERSDGALWIHSTKKEELFVRGFGIYAGTFPEPKHLTLEQFAGHLAGPFRFMGELIPEHNEWLHKKGGQRAELHPLEDVLPAVLAGETYERKTVAPWYGREG